MLVQLLMPLGCNCLLDDSAWNVVMNVNEIVRGKQLVEALAFGPLQRALNVRHGSLEVFGSVGIAALSHE